MPPEDPADDRERAGPRGGESGRRRIALNTAIFSAATGLSRIAGLVREIVASSYFATSGAFSAFTIAFQVPNLVRSLFADTALSAAFVPVFTELLEKGQKRDAIRLAGALTFLILAALGAITAAFVIAAPVVMPLFTGGGFEPALDELTVGLSRVLFPIVLLLGLNGLVLGVLYAYDEFTIPALAPLVWNLVIIVLLVVLRPLFDGDDQLYAYAIGVLAGTLVQLSMGLPMLRRLGFRLTLSVDFRDPRVRQVLTLMLPVTIGVGLINFNLLINSSLGSLVSEEAPRAIDAAFRIYMLPQGMFSVAVATVLFPALSRLAARQDRTGLRALTGTGVRQIFLLLLPAAAVTLVLAEPIIRLIYQHGEFGPRSTDQVSSALFWFSFSLPFAGANLLLTRTFFSLQRPWLPTALAGGTLALNGAVSAALYGPFEIAGIVVGTAVASAAMTVGQAWWLRRELGRIEGAQTLSAIGRMLVGALWLGIVAFCVWAGLDALLGRSVIAQAISVGVAITAGTVVYAAIVTYLRVPEAEQIRALVASRLGRAP